LTGFPRLPHNAEKAEDTPMGLINDIADTIWNCSQDSKLRELHQEVDRLKKSARTSATTDPHRAQIDDLKAANGELRLYIAALFRVLVQKNIISRDDLSTLVDQIDEEDGLRDRSFDGDVLP
jgi:hypothetical protein